MDDTLATADNGGVDPHYDYVKILELLMTSYFIKTFALFIQILCCCYFSAMFFRVILEVENSLMPDEYKAPGVGDCSDDGAWGYFEMCYGMDTQYIGRDILILLYYAFTTLSTVGFGDFNPKSNSERIYTAFFMLFGVMIFSYIMGNFITIMDEFTNVTADINDGDNLTRFFGVLEKFNRSEPIILKLKVQIEQYFEYRWQVDKNNIVNGDEYATVM